MKCNKNRVSENKRQRSIEKKIKKDISKLTEDWKRLQKHHELSQNTLFLQRMASELQALYEDSRALDEAQMSRVDDVLTTSFHEKTLLDAILSFPYQDPLQSDLCLFLGNFVHGTSLEENSWISLFGDMEDTLHQ